MLMFQGNINAYKYSFAIATSSVAIHLYVVREPLSCYANDSPIPIFQTNVGDIIHTHSM